MYWESVFFGSLEKQRKNIEFVNKQIETWDIFNILKRLRVKLLVEIVKKRICYIFNKAVNFVGWDSKINFYAKDKIEKTNIDLMNLEKYEKWLNFLKYVQQFGLDEFGEYSIKQFLSCDPEICRFLLKHLWKKYDDHYRYWCSVLYEKFEDKINF